MNFPSDRVPAFSARPRRGVSSLGCHELDLLETLALAARNRIGAVELRSLGGELDLPTWLERAHGGPAGLAGAWPAGAARVVGLNTSFKLGKNDGATRADLLRFVPWAEAMNVPWLRVFDGCASTDEADLRAAADTLAWWRDLRREKGWRTDFMIETHDALVTAPSLLRLVELAPGAAILWDTHHTWKKGGEDPVATWSAIRDHVVHVHVKDSISRPSARHSFTYVLPGDGEFRLRPVLDVLERDGYAGVVSLEWERQWHPYLPPLEEALRVADERGWW
jgi:sugar phosphate isomerase/epimerase